MAGMSTSKVLFMEDVTTVRQWLHFQVPSSSLLECERALLNYYY